MEPPNKKQKLNNFEFAEKESEKESQKIREEFKLAQLNKEYCLVKWREGAKDGLTVNIKSYSFKQLLEAGGKFQKIKFGTNTFEGVILYIGNFIR